MTTFVGQRIQPRAGSTSGRPALRRLSRFLGSLCVVMAESAQATREFGSANTPAARRAVIDKFSADTSR